MIYKKESCQLEHINTAKAVLMLMVVFYHSMLFWKGQWFTKNPVIEADYLNCIIEWLNSFHIYGFTAISGYLYYYVSVDIGKRKSIIGGG